MTIVAKGQGYIRSIWPMKSRDDKNQCISRTKLYLWGLLEQSFCCPVVCFELAVHCSVPLPTTPDFGRVPRNASRTRHHATTLRQFCNKSIHRRFTYAYFTMEQRTIEKLGNFGISNCHSSVVLERLYGSPIIASQQTH